LHRSSNVRPVGLFQSNQGIKTLDPTRAKALAGEQPDYAIADLYNAIARRDYPSWTLYVQVGHKKRNLERNELIIVLRL
jgi:catalase